jgi:hypothetical protein
MSKHVFCSLTSTVRFTRSKLKLTFNAALIPVLSLVFTLMIQAQVPQKFVSAKRGSDSASCTINLPCRTFAAAMLQVLPRGEIIALDVGDYRSVTITKAVTITGPVDGYATISVALGAAVMINTGSSDTVILRRLALSGPGPSGQVPFAATPGILFRSGEALSVDNCLIEGFPDPGIAFYGAGQLFVRNTTVRNCRTGGSNAGIRISPNSGKAIVFIDHSQSEKNDEGIVASGNAKVTVRNSVAASNSGYGFAATASAFTNTEMNLENCVATGNGVGIFSTTGIAPGDALIRVSNSTITNNNTGVFGNQAGLILSRGNNTLEGNTNNGSFTAKFDAK